LARPRLLRRLLCLLLLAVAVQGNIDKARHLDKLHAQRVERTRLDGLPLMAGRSAGRAPRPFTSHLCQLVGFCRLWTRLLVTADADERDRSSGRPLTTRCAALLHGRRDSSQHRQRLCRVLASVASDRCDHIYEFIEVEGFHQHSVSRQLGCVDGRSVVASEDDQSSCVAGPEFR